MLGNSDIPEAPFTPHAHRGEQSPCLFFLLNAKLELWVHRQGDQIRLPTSGDVAGGAGLEASFVLGSLGKFLCCTGLTDQPPAPGFETCDLREAMTCFDDALYSALARARMLQHWNGRSKFCGACGAALQLAESEISKTCGRCGEIYFPVIAPATITLIRKGDQLLLAHNRHFREGLYSIIAGFTEAGETLEACVRREILEEVGIRVRNVKYAGDQAWPFPHSHMIGFTAEYESGDINPDGHEITEARWFSVDDLPELPSSLSISRKLIDRFLAEVAGRKGGEGPKS